MKTMYINVIILYYFAIVLWDVLIERKKESCFRAVFYKRNYLA